jgi:hypothetical protein
MRAVFRRSTAIAQTSLAIFLKSLEPLVTRLAADAVPLAE